MSSSPIARVEFGACWNRLCFSALDCAVDAGTCFDSEGRYHSQHEIAIANVVEDCGSISIANRCQADHVVGGRCSEYQLCVNARDACGSFRVDESCDLKRDRLNGVGTIYPGCRSTDGVRCAWDRADCDAGTEEFVDAVALLDESVICHCDDVRTGACVDGSGEKICAVHRRSCGVNETFVSARKLEGDMDCRVCDSLDAAKTATVEDVRARTKESGSGSNGFDATPVVVGSIVGAAVVVLLVVFGAIIIVKKKTAAIREEAAAANATGAPTSGNTSTTKDSTVV